MACWIPGPWEEAWAPGLRLKRMRERAAANAATSAANLSSDESVTQPKRRGRKPKAALIED